MRALAIAVALLAACTSPPDPEPTLCQLSYRYTYDLVWDIRHCPTDNCVAWYVQREAIQRAACATERAGLATGVEQ